jgi:hypothetical protein
VGYGIDFAQRNRNLPYIGKVRFTGRCCQTICAQGWMWCSAAPPWGGCRRRGGHYYANPGNLFWRVLAETGLTPQRLRPEDDWRMPEFGLGLTDLAKGVAGQDADIPARPSILTASSPPWRRCGPGRWPSPA